MIGEDVECHRFHCCKTHGCKYCDPDCPVVLEEVTQEGPCEECEFEDLCQ
jgi:hypothetical protein